jgi:hypothetical protein
MALSSLLAESFNTVLVTNGPATRYPVPEMKTPSVLHSLAWLLSRETGGPKGKEGPTWVVLEVREQRCVGLPHQVLAHHGAQHLPPALGLITAGRKRVHAYWASIHLTLALHCLT